METDGWAHEQTGTIALSRMPMRSVTIISKPVRILFMDAEYCTQTEEAKVIPLWIASATNGRNI